MDSNVFFIIWSMLPLQIAQSNHRLIDRFYEHLLKICLQNIAPPLLSFLLHLPLQTLHCVWPGLESPSDNFVNSNGTPSQYVLIHRFFLAQLLPTYCKSFQLPFPPIILLFSAGIFFPLLNSLLYNFQTPTYITFSSHRQHITYCTQTQKCTHVQLRTHAYALTPVSKRTHECISTHGVAPTNFTLIILPTSRPAEAIYPAATDFFDV